MMNKHWVRTAVAAAMLAGSGAVMAEVGGTVAITSDYLFDGVSQTVNDPALQVGFDISDESGFYAGIWASNVDFETESDIETDHYIGYGWGSEAVAFDVGYVRYKYLDGLENGDFNLSDYGEWYFGVTFAENTTVKYWYAPDYPAATEFDGDKNAAHRVKVTHNIAINDQLSVGLEFTHSMDIYAGYDAINDEVVIDDLNHFRVGVGYALSDAFAFDLSYHKTDADKDYADEDIFSIDGNIVLTATYSY
ncbi:MAG: TorF family putative porin [Permianibacter sp.]